MIDMAAAKSATWKKMKANRTLPSMAAGLCKRAKSKALGGSGGQ
jgi:hypothetical protein